MLALSVLLGSLLVEGSRSSAFRTLKHDNHEQQQSVGTTPPASNSASEKTGTRLRKPAAQPSNPTAQPAVAAAGSQPKTGPTSTGSHGAKFTHPAVSLKAGVDLTNATRSISDGNPNRDTESMVEEALDEIEALDKQQGALRSAREAFDKAIIASQEAKEQAKKLAEEVVAGAEDIADPDGDDSVSVVQGTKQVSHDSRTRRAKGFLSDPLRCVGSFFIGGIVSRMVPSVGTMTGCCTGGCLPSCGPKVLVNLFGVRLLTSRRPTKADTLTLGA